MTVEDSCENLRCAQSRVLLLLLILMDPQEAEEQHPQIKLVAVTVDVIVKADPLIKTNSFSRFAKYSKPGANDMVQVAMNEMKAS